MVMLSEISRTTATPTSSTPIEEITSLLRRFAEIKKHQGTVITICNKDTAADLDEQQTIFFKKAQILKNLITAHQDPRGAQFDTATVFDEKRGGWSDTFRGIFFKVTHSGKVTDEVFALAKANFEEIATALTSHANDLRWGHGLGNCAQNIPCEHIPKLSDIKNSIKALQQVSTLGANFRLLTRELATLPATILDPNLITECQKKLDESKSGLAGNINDVITHSLGAIREKVSEKLSSMQEDVTNLTSTIQFSREYPLSAFAAAKKEEKLPELEGLYNSITHLNSDDASLQEKINGLKLDLRLAIECIQAGAVAIDNAIVLLNHDVYLAVPLEHATYIKASGSSLVVPCNKAVTSNAILVAHNDPSILFEGNCDTSDFIYIGVSAQLLLKKHPFFIREGALYIAAGSEELVQLPLSKVEIRTHEKNRRRLAAEGNSLEISYYTTSPKELLTHPGEHMINEDNIVVATGVKPPHVGRLVDLFRLQEVTT